VSVCVVSLCVRVCNTVLLQTFFSPDEYWQALEPAHVAVFGYGALTWEWTAMIRSFIHPLIYAIPYQLLRLFSLDHTFLRVNIYASLFLDTSYLHFTSLHFFFFLQTLAPKLLNALFATVCDLSTFRLAFIFFGHGPARWTVFCLL